MFFPSVTLFESIAIVHYLLRQYDPLHKLAPAPGSDPAADAAWLNLSFFACGTVDNLAATFSPVQPVLNEKEPGNAPEIVVRKITKTDSIFI